MIGCVAALASFDRGGVRAFEIADPKFWEDRERLEEKGVGLD